MDDFKYLKSKVRENQNIKNYLDSFTSQIAKLVFKQRVEMKITQSELAELAKVTQATISRIEAGDTGIKGETYNKVMSELKFVKAELSFDEEAAAKQEQQLEYC